jgi:hypothetical protein
LALAIAATSVAVCAIWLRIKPVVLMVKGGPEAEFWRLS